MLTAVRTASLALVLVLPAAAQASSDEAWKEFAKQVEQKCSAAAGDVFRKPLVAVDPTGSESFGLAIVYGRAKAAKAPAAIICVVDKKSGKVEIGTELGPDVVRVRKPKPEGQDKTGAQKQTDNKSAPASGASGDDEDEQ